MENLTAYIDGASKGNPGRASIGFVIYSEKKGLVKKYGAHIGYATNNSAEYLALIAALIECLCYLPANLEIRSDSLLLIKQMQGKYRVRDEWLKKLQFIATLLISRYNKVSLRHIPREENREADRIAEEYVKDDAKLF